MNRQKRRFCISRSDLFPPLKKGGIKGGSTASRDLASLRTSPYPLLRKEGRAGFTLTEVLVVIGVTALLLVLVFTPMMAAFRWMQQGRAMVATQDTARTALERISREVGTAVHIYDPPVRWDRYANGGDGAWVEDRSRVDLLLPGRMLSNTPEGSYLRYPMTPEGKIVTYFIGLRDTRYDRGNGNNGYANDNLNERQEGPNNLYWLYRAEFDPFHPDEDDWTATTGLNPCYDETDWCWRTKEWLDWSGPNEADIDNLPPGWPDGAGAEAVADGITARRDYLRKRGQLVALVPINDCDMVQASFDSAGPGGRYYTVVPGFTIQPAAIVNEVMKPADSQSDGDATHSPPTVYRAANGHWCGARNNGGIWSNNMSWPNPTDPLITVYADEDGSGTPEMVFDSAGPTGQHRTLTYDSEKGAVMFATRHTVPVTYNPVAPEFGDPAGRIAAAYPNVQFKLTTNPTEMAIERTLKVKVTAANKVIRFHRGGGTVGTGQGYLTDPSASQNDFTTLRADLEPMVVRDGVEETLVVKFNYNRLAYILQDAGATRLDFTFEYDVQDNTANDVVKVSYRTPSLMSATISPRIYPGGSTKPETFQLTATVKPMNLHR